MGDQARGTRAGLLEFALQSEAEVEVRELCLTVSAPGAVSALQMRIARVHGAAHVVCGARSRDDPPAGRPGQRGQQQCGQRPVPEVVDAELHLVCRLLLEKKNLRAMLSLFMNFRSVFVSLKRCFLCELSPSPSCS